MAVGNLLVTIPGFVIRIGTGMIANKTGMTCLDSAQVFREVVSTVNRQAKLNHQQYCCQKSYLFVWETHGQYPAVVLTEVIILELNIPQL